jgi:hypothetical protein
MIMKHYKFLLLLFIFSPTYSFSQMKPLFEAPAGVAYENVQWSWFDKDSEFAKKRDEAVDKLRAQSGEFISPYIIRNGRLMMPEDRVKKTLQFHWDSIENGNYILGAEPTWVPTGVTDDLLRETLPYLPDLKCIVLQMTSVTDEGVRLFSCLKYLEDVRFVSGDPEKFPLLITPKSLEILTKQNNLKSIALCGIKFTDKDIQFLENMRSLEIVKIRYCPLTSDCFRTLVKIPNLNRLELEGIDLSKPIPDDVVKVIEAGSCKLTNLDLSKTKPSKDLVRALMKIKTLEDIRLNEIPPKDSWDDIAKMENIQWFDANAWPFGHMIHESVRNSEMCDPDWVRFYATKIKPRGQSAHGIKFRHDQLGKYYPEIDSWMQEAEQRDKEKLLQRE